MHHLKLLNNSNPNNAAFVLFGKTPETIFTQCEVKLARFRGTDKLRIQETKIAEGNIFYLLGQLSQFVLNHLPITSSFTDPIKRNDEPFYPAEVLREVFANALCHRDYSEGSPSVNCAVYDDRMEVWNPGLLLRDLSVETLADSNVSHPRNQLIARALYFRGLIEEWGLGINLIISNAVNAGHPKPIFTERSGGFCVTLSFRERLYSKLKHSTILLTEQQENILSCLKNTSGLSTSELALQLGPRVNQRSIQRSLKVLNEHAYVYSSGRTRTQKWHVITTYEKP